MSVPSDVSHFSLLVCSSFCRTCLLATSYAWCIFCLFGTLAYVTEACKNSWNIQVVAPTELSWCFVYVIYMCFFWQTKDKLQSIGIREVSRRIFRLLGRHPDTNLGSDRKIPKNLENKLGILLAVDDWWGTRSRFWVNCFCQHANPEFDKIICKKNM